jgi:hypothetical protein
MNGSAAKAFRRKLRAGLAADPVASPELVADYSPKKLIREWRRLAAIDERRKPKKGVADGT